MILGRVLRPLSWFLLNCIETCSQFFIQFYATNFWFFFFLLFFNSKFLWFLQTNLQQFVGQFWFNFNIIRLKLIANFHSLLFNKFVIRFSYFFCIIQLQFSLIFTLRTNLQQFFSLFLFNFGLFWHKSVKTCCRFLFTFHELIFFSELWSKFLKIRTFIRFYELIWGHFFGQFLTIIGLILSLIE